MSFSIESKRSLLGNKSILEQDHLKEIERYIRELESNNNKLLEENLKSKGYENKGGILNHNIEVLKDKIILLEQDLEAYRHIQGLDVFDNGFAELIFHDGEVMLINNVVHRKSNLATWAQKNFGIKNNGMGDPGNLRHVVYMLMKEAKLSTKEFSEKINYTEKEINDLLNKGIVTDSLLTSICNYFNINKTPEFIRYVYDANV